MRQRTVKRIRQALGDGHAKAGREAWRKLSHRERGKLRSPRKLERKLEAMIREAAQVGGR